jgi:dihydroorotate dehydrogenase electron transfer subunit
VADAVAPSCAAQRTVRVVENVRLARDTFRLRLDDPELARAIRPGQFLMVRPAEGTDPLLGRPFALYDVVRDAAGTPVAVDVVYLVIGKGTAALASRRPGDRVTLWGPLGNGFGAAPGGDAWFLAGGIGQTPFLALGRAWKTPELFGLGGTPCRSATLFYGVRTAELLAGVDDFRKAGMRVEVATDDGSTGHRGFVTDLARRALMQGERPALAVACGPPPMLRAAAALMAEFGVPCLVSLENHMACGFGVCFSCVMPIRQADGTSDLRRVCVEGPIFDARDVVFEGGH